MSISNDDTAFVEELFAPLGPVTHRKMMGGLTIYSQGQVFAILDSQGTVFLKAKGAFADTMKNAGARRFGADDGARMGYWTMPDDGIDDPEIAATWARQALANI
ncbi:MAG: TfoX/Sxy family protein [Paracoccaceae bacterium]